MGEYQKVLSNSAFNVLSIFITLGFVHFVWLPGDGNGGACPLPSCQIECFRIFQNILDYLKIYI